MIYSISDGEITCICINSYKLVDQFGINYFLAVVKRNCILNGVGDFVVGL